MRVLTIKATDGSKTTYVRRWCRWYVISWKWLTPIKVRKKKNEITR